MKGLLLMANHLLTWQRAIRWAHWVGLTLLAITVPVAFAIDRKASFGLSIYGAVIGLALPYLVVGYPFRLLISSRRLALVPGLRVRAGLALLSLTVLLSAVSPLASTLFWPGATDPLFGPRAFVIASAYVFLMQWVIGSPLVVLFLSVVPFTIVTLLNRFQGIASWLFFDAGAVLTLFAMSILGWVVGICLLATRRTFRPPYKTLLGDNSGLWKANGLWRGLYRFGARGRYGEIDSPAATLLLGYPAGWVTRFRSMGNMVIVSPLAAVLFLSVAGIGDWNGNPMRNLMGLYAMFSLFMAILTGLGSSELAARGRLLWLRHGGGRDRQWRLLEQTTLANLAIIALCVAAIATLSVIARVENFRFLDYLLAGVSGSLMASYFGLAARIKRWSVFRQLVILVVLAVALLIGFVQTVVSGPVIALAMLGLALLFRLTATDGFREIDWHLVQPVLGVRG